MIRTGSAVAFGPQTHRILNAVTIGGMPRRWAGREYDNEKMKNMEIFIRTFHNGDYDTELDNSFSIDRSENVTLPDRPTHQASYKKPDNWAERNQIGLVKMKRRLQSYIDSVSHHTSLNWS